MKKKFLSILLTIALAVPMSTPVVTASAASVINSSGASIAVEESGTLPTISTDNFDYSILSDGTLMLRKLNMTDTNNIAIPSKIDGKTVTMLSGYFLADTLFNGIDLDKPISISIPETVSYIEPGAFVNDKTYSQGGKQLSVSILVDQNNSSYTVSNDTLFTRDKKQIITVFSSDTEYNVDEGVEYIACHAFSNTDIKNVTLPSSVKTIGNNAFDDSGIVSINLNEGLEIIDQEAFAWCNNLEKIFLPSTLRRLGNGAFRYCKNLSEVNIPKSLVSLGEGAFESTAIYSIELPEKCKAIPAGLFSECVSLEHVELPEGIESIGLGAFRHCVSLKDFSFPDSVKEIVRSNSYNDNYGFVENNVRYEYMIDNYTNRLGLSVVCAEGTIPGNLIIPESVRGIHVNEIRDYAFQYNEDLTSVTIPSSISAIGMCAFDFCENLERIDFSEGLIRIGQFAFRNCEKLKNYSLPKSAVDIGDDAFYSVESNDDTEYFITDDGLLKYYYFNNSETGKREIAITDTPANYWDYSFPFEIPSQINGVPVTSVKSLGSWSPSDSVILPDSITDLGDSFSTVDGRLTYAPRNDDDFSYYYVVDDKTHKLGLGLMFDYSDESGKYYWSYNDEIGLYVGNNPESVTIPAEVDGYPVLEIGENAFKDFGYGGRSHYSYNDIYDINKEQQEYIQSLTHLRTVTIPDSVVRIAENAFSSCGYLTEINIPKSVHYIAANAFDGCSSLEEITLPPDIDLGWSGNKTVQSYWWYYFGYEQSVEYLDIFGECINLKRVDVAEGSKYLYSEDGVLFNKDKSVLIYYPTGKQDEIYRVPDGVKKIYGTAAVKMANGARDIGAFSNNNYIKEVVLPESLEMIDSGAFTFCSSLKKIVIPRNTKTIGYNAFTKSMYDFNARSDLSAEESAEVYIYRDSPIEASSAYRFKYVDEKVIDTPEPASDTSADTDTDSQTDVSTDSGTDTQTDVFTDSDTDSRTDISTESDTDSQTDVSTDSGTDTQTDVFTDSDTDSRTDISAESDTDSQSDITTDSDNDSETDISTDSDTDSESDSSRDSDTDTDETYTYYFLAPNDWFDTSRGAYNEDIGAYYWYDDNNTPVAWPGVKMIRCPEIGENVFKIEGVPADMAYIIFNAYFNVGRNSTPEEIAYAHQTDNLSLGGYKKGECPYDSELTTENFNGWICVCDCTDLHENAINVCYNTGSAWFTLDDYKKYSDYYGTYDIGDDQPIGVLGDVDSDSEITANDALTILRSSVGMESFTPEQTKLADVDNDTEITANDALAVLRYSVGLTDENSPINKPVAA